MNIVSQVGRIVQGSASFGATTDFYNEPLVWKKGANAGQPRQEWYVGIALAKGSPGADELFAQMMEVANTARRNNIPQNYAFKFIDGDAVDGKGKSYAEREGHAGHYIFRFTTSFQPKCYQDDGSGRMVEIPPEQVKSGYYVQVAGSIEDNGDMNKPGLYLNLNMISLVAYGQEIVSGPNADQVFGGQSQSALPAGASRTPMNPPNQFAGMAQGQPQQATHQPPQGMPHQNHQPHQGNGQPPQGNGQPTHPNQNFIQYPGA